MTPTERPPLPPFTRESAIQKARAAEDAWNTCDAEPVSLAYSLDSRWRNRHEFLTGRHRIVEFLTSKWAKEKHYRLIKELWAFTENRIAVRFAYEVCDHTDQWFRAYGNENWEFDVHRLMRARHASRRRGASAAEPHTPSADTSSPIAGLQLIARIRQGPQGHL